MKRSFLLNALASTVRHAPQHRAEARHSATSETFIDLRIRRIPRIVISALLFSGIALLTQACTHHDTNRKQSEDETEIKLVVDILREGLPHLDKDGFELSFAIESNDDLEDEVVVTCNSTSEEQPCEDFASGCEALGGGGSSEPGGGDSCSFPDE